MNETRNLQLPLLMPAQAQKHVTVNEALALIDALAPLGLESRSLTVPPVEPPDGTAHAVPSGAIGAWSGQAGRIAIYANGGWLFAEPRPGWRAWLADEGRWAVWDGAGWRGDVVALSPSGAATRARIVETVFDVPPGTTAETAPLIPAGVQVIGVTGRLLSDLSGTLSSFDLGVAGGEDRYGNGLGLLAGAFIRGLSGTPVTYYEDTPLLLSANDGAFAGGSLRLSVHLVELDPSH